MREKRIRILAWGLGAVSIIGALVQVILWALHLANPLSLDAAVEALGWGFGLPVIFSILSALIIARHPGNRVGWLMMVVALVLVSPVETILNQHTGSPESITAGLWLLIWLDFWLWIPAIFPIFLIPLYFPTGKPPSPRWNWVGRLTIAMWIVFMFIAAFIEETGPLNEAWTTANPIGFIPNTAVD